MLSARCGVSRRLGLTCAGLAALSLLVTSAAFPQQKLETPQETNERIRRLASAMHAKQGDYLVGSGDLVRIEVFDVPELSRDVRVGESGYISLPLLPVKVRASGLTAFQLEEKLAELLQTNGLVSHPQVTVFVKEQRSQPITVIGAVGHSLVYQAIRQTTLLEVLSEAGGIANDAGSTVIVTHAGSDNATGDPGAPGGNISAPPATITINLNDLLESGDAKFNIPLQGGDVVTVPRAGIVYVVGAVEKPGGYVLANEQERITALKVLALAGGTKGTAKLNQAVILRKNADTGQRQEVNVDLGKILERKIEDVRLLPSDILFVPDSTGKRALRRVGDVALSLTTGLIVVRAAR
ncbi:MAG: polysaccharide biosynthesis/export family protein [Acidobacteria bacterium]|nr:polysaccharide biosynthesis/export family protein [Acidobacteriota bacterium]